jgi:hypothetical protein
VECLSWLVKRLLLYSNISNVSLSFSCRSKGRNSDSEGKVMSNSNSNSNEGPASGGGGGGGSSSSRGLSSSLGGANKPRRNFHNNNNYYQKPPRHQIQKNANPGERGPPLSLAKKSALLPSGPKVLPRGVGDDNLPEGTCVLCYREALVFSLGACDHPVCYECSARMRVLLGQSECPICRQAMPEVLFVREMALYSSLADKKRRFIFLPQWGLYLQDAKLQDDFNVLLEHRCPFCPEGSYNNNVFPGGVLRILTKLS